MRKTLLRYQTAILAAALLILASCAGNDFRPENLSEPEAIAFDTYVGKSTDTRNVYASTGSIDTDAALQKAGFGVFAVYTDNQEFNGTMDYNFMMNQKVEYKSGAWTYSPIKYWPNERGEADSDGRTDRLSFFAYAPYTSKEYWQALEDHEEPPYGITDWYGKEQNTTYMRYRVAKNPAESVDLMWGTNADGLPYTNMVKQKVGESIKFYFHHVLSMLDLKVQAAFDEVTPSSNAKPEKTKILIKKIELHCNWPTHANMSLNNNEANKPKWMGGLNFDDSDPFHHTKFEVDQNNGLREALQYQTPTNADGFASLHSGVTADLQSVFDDGTHFMLLPTTCLDEAVQNLRVEIEYTVITKDETLVLNDTHPGLSVVTNKVTATLDHAFDLESSKRYTLKMLLGMTSVKFIVTKVNGWEEEEEDEYIIFEPTLVDWGEGGNTDIEIDLPEEKTIIYVPAVKPWTTDDDGTIKVN